MKSNETHTFYMEWMIFFIYFIILFVCCGDTFMVELNFYFSFCYYKIFICETIESTRSTIKLRIYTRFGYDLFKMRLFFSVHTTSEKCEWRIHNLKPQNPYRFDWNIYICFIMHNKNVFFSFNRRITRIKLVRYNLYFFILILLVFQLILIIHLDLDTSCRFHWKLYYNNKYIV